MSSKMQAIDIAERNNIMKMKNESKDPNIQYFFEYNLILIVNHT